MPAILTVTGELLEVKPNQSGSFASFSIKSMNNDGQRFTFQNGKTFNAEWITYLQSLQLNSQVQITGEMRNEKAQVSDGNGGWVDDIGEDGEQVYKQTFFLG